MITVIAHILSLPPVTCCVILYYNILGIIIVDMKTKCVLQWDYYTDMYDTKKKKAKGGDPSPLGEHQCSKYHLDLSNIYKITLFILKSTQNKYKIVKKKKKNEL